MKQENISYSVSSFQHRQLSYTKNKQKNKQTKKTNKKYKKNKKQQ